MKSLKTRQQLWQEKKKAEGLCITCGRRKLHTTCRCKACAAEVSVISLKNYYKKKSTAKK